MGGDQIISNTSFSSPTDVGSHNLPPWGLASLLTYRPVSGSDTICSSPSSPPVDIVLFRFSLPGFSASASHHPVTGFDTICNSSNPRLVNIFLFRLLKKDKSASGGLELGLLHSILTWTLISEKFSSLKNQAECAYSTMFLKMAVIEFELVKYFSDCTTVVLTRQTVLYHRQPHGFKMRLLERCFHALMKKAKFESGIDSAVRKGFESYILVFSPFASPQRTEARNLLLPKHFLSQSLILSGASMEGNPSLKRRFLETEDSDSAKPPA
ncbi:hypothetical protein SDJN02_16280, partial [Cucurbita argyrosperma subsp. argyrosperma]